MAKQRNAAPNTLWNVNAFWEYSNDFFMILKHFAWSLWFLLTWCPLKHYDCLNVWDTAGTTFMHGNEGCVWTRHWYSVPILLDSLWCTSFLLYPAQTTKGNHVSWSCGPVIQVSRYQYISTTTLTSWYTETKNPQSPLYGPFEQDVFSQSFFHFGLVSSFKS